MLKTILGSKGKMGQTFIEGSRVPVTKIAVGPCLVTQLKTLDKDGYWAVQLGYGERKIKNITKPVIGHLIKSQNSKVKNQNYPRYLREIRLEKEPEVKVGDLVKVADIFSVGDIVAVTGISKGKGFAGGVKRWHFKGGPKTHGQSDRQRAPGSIGATTTPGRVLKGKHMAGRMGSDQITVKSFHLLAIDSEKNEILVSGPVPGRSGGLVMVKKIGAGNLADLKQKTVSRVVEGSAAKIAGTAGMKGDQNAQG